MFGVSGGIGGNGGTFRNHSFSYRVAALRSAIRGLRSGPLAARCCDKRGFASMRRPTLRRAALPLGPLEEPRVDARSDCDAVP